MNSPKPVYDREPVEGEQVAVASATELRRVLNRAWLLVQRVGSVEGMSNLVLAELALRDAQNRAVDVGAYSALETVSDVNEHRRRIEAEAYNRGYENARNEFQNWDRLLDAEAERDSLRLGYRIKSGERDSLQVRVDLVRAHISAYLDSPVRPDDADFVAGLVNILNRTISADHVRAYNSPAPTEPPPHAWTAPFSAASDLCARMVVRAGGGDTCGLPRTHPIHRVPAPFPRGPVGQSGSAEPNEPADHPHPGPPQGWNPEDGTLEENSR